MIGFLKKARTLLACVITLTILISTVSIAEVHAGHWADAQMNKWNVQGMLKGDANGDFRPNDSITRAEFMALINRMQGYSARSEKVGEYKDVKAEDWYYDTVAVALEAGYINGVSADMMEPKGLITREQAMAILSRISEVKKDSSAYMKANDSAMVSEWAKEGVSTCIAQGFITGSNGNLNPLANITRAEAVVMLDRKLTDTRMFGFAGEYDLAGQEVKNLEVLSDKITVKNATVKENLVIKDTVGDGDVHLDAVNVEGNLYANGGGEHSLYFNSVRVDGSLIVHKYDGKIRIVASGSTKTKMTVLESGAILVNQSKDGKTFEEILIKTEDSSTEIELVGDFNKVENSAKGVDLKLDGKVEKLTLNEDTKISGEAEVKKLETEENVEVKVETANGEVQTLKGDTSSLTVKGDKLTESDKPAKTDGEDSLGGGSTGSDPSNGTSTTTGSGTTVDPNAGGSGSGTGSGTGTGTTSGAGTNVTTEPNTTMSSYVDPRFADGYPKLKMQNGDAIFVIKFKDASVSEPLEVFVTQQRTIKDGQKYDKNSVLEGKMEKGSSITRPSFYLKVSDTKEHLIDTGHRLWEDNINFVIRDKAGALGEVTSIKISKDTQNNLDESKPWIYRSGKPDEIGIYMNKEKNAIYAYIWGEMDMTPMPAPSDFKLSNGTVTAVDMGTIYDKHKFTYVKLSVKDVTSDDITVSYTKGANPIKDKAKPKGNEMDSFKDYKVRKVAAKAIKRLDISYDKMSVSVELNGIMYDKNWRIKILSNGSEISYKNNSSNGDRDGLEFVKYGREFEETLDTTNFTVSVINRDGNKIRDYAFDEYDSLDISNGDPRINQLEKLSLADTAVFADDKISIDVLSGKMHSYFSAADCMKMSIDGKEYFIQYQNYDSSNVDTKLLIGGDTLFGKSNRIPKEYSYYYQYLLPKMKDALDNGKEVKLIYDPSYGNWGISDEVRNKMMIRKEWIIH